MRGCPLTWGKSASASPGQLIRIVRGIEGTVETISRCAPRPDYGRSQPQFTDKGATISFNQFTLSGPAEWQTNSALLDRRLTLAAGEQAAFTLTTSADNDHPPLEPTAALSSTTDFWPVRIGNQAAQQVQLDVYGEVLSAIHFAWKADKYDPTELWSHIHPLMDWVSTHWHSPDNGIWEIRGKKKHYVYSKAMMWVALDCGIEISEALSLAGDVDRWRNSRQQIKAEVIDKGWSDRLGAFRQAYESEVIDASNLLLPTMGFIKGNDPKMLSTIDATINELVSSGLCYRYKKHPVSGQTKEGTFVLRTFWLINALIRAGRLAEADKWFEQMLVKSSPLGLFAEEKTLDTGLQLGNFPQAFSHFWGDHLG